jgi:hypothetical protein
MKRTSFNQFIEVVGRKFEEGSFASFRYNCPCGFSFGVEN